MMLKWRTTGLAAMVAVAATGCTAPGAWMGADAEKVYDKELEAKRLAAVINNDDYYQVVTENRIYVLSDAKDFIGLLKTGEVPKTVTKIGGGPNGERLIYGVTSSESKAMESKVGFKGGAQEMYEGNRKGLDKGFFGVLSINGRYVVTDDWSIADGFRKGTVPAGGSTGTSPDGKPVTYVVKGDVKEAQQRFAKLFP